ncbi:hypothetical protein SAMN05444354_11824 [Stigmatella aurantiaca]|uniref:Uncharacterized protein n=1 Tax=Stigmatella aurantiaca TaxID=41 RepID=A0A1H7Z1B1_STIAU|nr:hypothetical protein [Stigmatella aurantiaca]SEM51995.1 hypothetical protein SAMN05444354_11824 [Stigmatella aurantiaca]
MAGHHRALLRRAGILFACCGLAALSSPLPAQAATRAGEEQIIPVVGAGSAAEGSWFPLEDAFDDQPTLSPPTQERYLSTDGGRVVSLVGGRQAYIDFGPGFANLQITGTWTLWNQWGRTAQTPLTYWWSSTKDPLFNNDDVAETTPGFGFVTKLPPTNPSSDPLWHRDYTGTGLTPKRRYLIVSAASANTNGAVEFAFTGRVNAPEPRVVPAPAFGALTLIDEVNCGDPNDPHAFQQFPANISRIETVLGRPVRVLPNDVPGRKYFAYRLGYGKELAAGKAYVLSVEYPDDVPRTMIISNNGAEYTRAFHTGNTVGDALLPPYVNPNAESLELPQTGEFQTWQSLFHLHDRYPLIKRPRDKEFPRDQGPSDGFWVAIAQFRPEDGPLSRGAAAAKIRLYEAPASPAYYAQVRLPPAGLPQRHLFFREEMADGVINQDAGPYLGVSNRVSWYEYKARLMKFLGMNTFSKDLLEFGHNQGWDSTAHGGNNWVYQSRYPGLWGETLTMLERYDLNVLPYYEYAGSIGYAGLGNQKRALPLTRTDAYTHISWTEGTRADLTDPDTLADFKKMLDLTVVQYAGRKKFTGVWLRPRSSHLPIGFADATLARFAAEANGGTAITRAQLQADSALRQRYYTWWMGKRRAFIDSVTDYLRAKGVGNDVVTLFTSDATEAGRSHPVNGDAMTAENPAPWLALGKSVLSLDRALSESRQLNTLVQPRSTWGGWEWQHADPWSDPQNYVSDTKGALTYTFNHAYTVGRPDALNAFRSGAGLAMVRHYALNEDTMTENNDPLLGYFVTDTERAGPYTMLAEARAVAHGDPRFIGYLSSASFNRGFPEYVRAFNQAFLALPALPSQVVPNAASNGAVVVRAIPTPSSGTYLAVVNTGVRQVDDVTVTLPATGSVTDAATGAAVPVVNGKLTLSMYPAQLRAFRVGP